MKDKIEQQVKEYSEELKKLGIENQILTHPASKSIDEVITSLGKTRSDSAATLIMKSGNEFIAIIRRDDTRLDTKKIKKLLHNNSLRVATDDEFTSVTGLVPGAATYYNKNISKVLIDEKVLEKEYIVGGSGSFSCSILHKTSDLIKIPGAKIVEVSDGSLNKINFYISSEVKSKYPDLDEVVMPVYGVNVKTDLTILSAKDFKDSLGGLSDDEFYNQDELKFFKNFCEELNINLKKFPPSVEFLFNRFQKSGKVPHVNNAVDSANKVAVETLVATGVFDLDQIKGDLVLRFSKEGEEFKPLGGDTENLSAGLVVIADDEKILNLFPFRDSIYQKITEKTKNVLILADKMPEGSLKRVEDAVKKIGNLLEKYCGGKAGEISNSILKEEKGLVVTIEDLNKEVAQKRRRVFSATRATGRLHLGNYLGAVKGYLALQEDPRFECVFMVVDLHTITTPFDHHKLAQASREIIIDYLACGLDPNKVVVTAQSLVPEHTYLSFLFSSAISVARMQHLPTFKEKVKQHPDGVTMALLNYPVLMAADILVYKAGLVPVGVDQEPHLEVAREIARKMNETYGTDFPEPIRFATKGEYVPSLLGEGKMSKSVEGSSIFLSDSFEVIRKKVSKIPTDSGVIKINGEYVDRDGPNFGLKPFVKLFLGDEKVKEIVDLYIKTGKRVNYGELKSELSEAIYSELKPIQEKRKYYEENPGIVDKIIKEGAEKARRIAGETLGEVKEKMGFISSVKK